MKSYFFTKPRILQYWLIGGDLLWISVSFLLACALAGNWEGRSLFPVVGMQDWGVAIGAMSIGLPLVLYVQGFYSPAQLIKTLAGVGTFFASIIVGAGVVFGLTGFFSLAPWDVVVSGVFILLFALCSWLWRNVFLSQYRRLHKHKTLALFGTRSTLEETLQDFLHLADEPFRIFCICATDDPSGKLFPQFGENLRYFPSLTQLLADKDIDVLAIEKDLQMSNEEIRQVFQFRSRLGHGVYDLDSLYGAMTGKVSLAIIRQRKLATPGFQRSEFMRYLRFKRLLDFCVGVLFGIITFPLMILTGLAVWLESDGPVIFAQERLGFNGKPFRCYKFRTMIHEAEKETGPVWAGESDSRLTRIGSFLRRVRLDELPQMYNILKGEMSLVGPRPIREHFAKNYSQEIPLYDFRYNVKPGLTGWAQVHGCQAVPHALETLQYDLFYIHHMSWILDIHIILRTFKLVVRFSERPEMQFKDNWIPRGT